MGSLSIWHWMVVIVVVMLVFGRGKVSELMGDVAQGIKAFKKGMSDDDTVAAPPPAAPAAAMRTLDPPPVQTAPGLAARAEAERKAEGSNV